MAKLERNLARQIDEYLKDNGIYKLNTNGCAVAGTPDRLVCYKGVFVALELKSDTGKLTLMQKYVLKQISDSGGRAYVIRSVDELRSTLARLDNAIGKRKRGEK
ncbi:MAG: VRR-NUC domain-containing protein [Clostridiales bacterium]|jgi:hypothetical protein|nr:VRR-NUC domain-containing protein [Clostridiales bacterium]